MFKLSDTKREVVHFENFAQTVENDFPFPEIPIGIVGKLDRWFISLRKKVNGDEISFVPFISNNSMPKNAMYQIDYLFEWKNKKKELEKSSSRKYAIELNHDEIFLGCPMNFFNLMNPKNGWLDENGTISVEYGFRIKANRGDDQIWRFNFYDKILDKEQFRLENVELFYGGHTFQTYYGYKQILEFHTNYFDGFPEDSVFTTPGCDSVEIADMCFQIAHGVQIQEDSDLSKMIRIARHFELWNVTRYCEQKLIEKLRLENFEIQKFVEKMEESGSDFPFQTVVEFYLYSSEFRMRRLAGVILRNINSEREMKDFLKGTVVFLLSGEAIKMMVRKVFDFYT
ncbi:unnamed protein product [Caenorhabditis nigoni]